jgi:signal transduction histidine kinase
VEPWLGVKEAVTGPVSPPRRWPVDRTRRMIAMAVAAVLASGWAGGAIAQMIDVEANPSLAVFVGLAQAGPVAFAVRWPVAAWRVTAIGLLAGAVLQSGRDLFWPWPVTSWLALMAVLIQVGICHGRRTAIGAGLVTAVVVVLAVPFASMPLWFAPILWTTIALAVVFGDALGGRRTAEEGLRDAQAGRRVAEARQAVLEERARIARELHDVVAHHMSVIALQAEAAPYKMSDLSPDARRTFEVIRTAARDALTETRRVVGLIRQDDEQAERLPSPGLERLDGLVDAARSTGLTVTARVVGVPRPLAAGVDLSAYRIIQEALSNATRYAAGSTVEVTVHYGADRLAVSVVDDGPAPGSTPPPGPGGGHGLVGMRERVAMLDGTLRTGPRKPSGFEVVADLPYGAA